MKKVLALALAGLLTACSSSSSDETPKTNNCSDTCDNAFAGLTIAADGTVACDEYAPALYEGGTVSCSDTCEADLTACVEKSTPAAGEFQSCSANVPCQEGLECTENPIDNTKFACLTPCTATQTGDAAECNGNVCVGFTQTTAYCLQSADRDQECLTNFKWCTGTNESCEYAGADDNDNDKYRCKAVCEATEIGTAGTCAEGESCLESGFIDTVQTTDGAAPAAEQANWVACTEDTECNGAEGFECIELTVGSFCTRAGAWCGNSVALCGTLNGGQTALAECYQNTPCSTDFGSNICGSIVSTDAEQDPALAYCYDLDGTNGICIGICDGRLLGDGTGPDRNCGEGYECLPLNEPFFGIGYYDPENEEELFDCTSEECPEGYTCYDLNNGGKGCFGAENACQQVATTGGDQ